MLSNNINEMDLGKTVEVDPIVLKAIGYLKTLNNAKAVEFSTQSGVDVDSVDAAQLSTVEEIQGCLSFFLENNIWLGFLFNRGDIWKTYILDLIEDEKFKDPITLVMNHGFPSDFMLYVRACYRFGSSAIPDMAYDILEKFYIKAYNMDWLDKQVQEDDTYTPIVESALKMTKFSTSRSSTAKVASGSFAALNAEKSTSIKPLRSVEEVYEYLCNAPKVRTHWSLKADGVNTKGLLKDNGGGLEVAISRGRAADGFDYTEALNLVLQHQNVDFSKVSGKVTGESIVEPSYISVLNDKYPDKDYKSPKSAAGAMLRAPQQFDTADYNHLKFYPFECGDMLKDEAFRTLKDAGFSMLPSVEFDYEEINLNSLEEFSSWLDSNILDPIWEKATDEGIGSDGVVLQILTEIESDRADKYSDLNVALKFSHWTESEYQSKVVDILFEQNRVEISVVLKIEPVTTRDFNVATRVGIGSTAILVHDGVKIGDTIAFTRKSEANNVYLRKVIDNGN